MKNLSLLLVIMLAFGMLTSCGTGGQETAQETPSDNIDMPLNLGDDVKRVGDAEFGFITIPEDWINFMDIGMLNAEIPHIGFKSLDGVIINLINYGIIYGINLEQFMEDTGSEFERAVIDGHEAFRVVEYFEDWGYLYGWYFADSNEYFRLITVEGPSDYIQAAVAIVEQTFAIQE